MDKKRRSIEVLLAVLAFALIIIGLLSFLKFDGYFDSLTDPWKNCWNKFLLPVGTNLVATLFAIFVSLLIVRWFLPERSEEVDNLLIDAIEKKLWPKLEHAIKTQFDALRDSMLNTLLSHHSGSQFNNERSRSISKEYEDSEQQVSEMGERATVSQKKSNKKSTTNMSESKRIEDLELSDLKRALGKDAESEILRRLLDRKFAEKEWTDGAETASRAAELRERLSAYRKPYSFQAGQIVRWKPGMKNKKRPAYGEPAIIVEVLSSPVFDQEQEAGSAYFREPLDILLGVIDADGDFSMYHFDSKRFETAGGTDHIAIKTVSG